MKTAYLFIAAATALALVSPAQAYDGLEKDYQICTTGSGKVDNKVIVGACTRLINNAQAKNEIVGFFHALRAVANTDRKQNCHDAKVALELLKGEDLKSNARALIKANC